MGRVERAIEILQWSTSNNKTITEGCKHFKVSEAFVRHARAVCKEDHPLHKQLINLNNRCLKKQVQESSTIEVDDLLDKSFIVEQEKVSFQEDLEGRGILDARGNKHVHTLEDLIKEANIDLKVWEIERHVINKWDVTTAGGTTNQNWQVKAWLKKRVEVEQAIDAVKLFKELVGAVAPVKRPVYNYSKKEQNLLEINIFDLHLGKLCWGEEVNNNYDIKIASARFNYALDMLIKRAQSFDFERILFPVGNDFFNSDNHLNTTTMGTRQDEDVRWKKSFKIGHKLLTDGIDRLREFAPVDVLVIPGNHDFTKSFYLGEVLTAFYRNDGSVTIDNGANHRKYYEYGNNLIGLTHGDKESHEKLRSLMAGEAKAAWARTLYREWHLGHQHRKLSKAHVVKSDFLHEELFVTIRSMSSLAGTDVWHHENGYLGPVRAAEAFIWNKQTGLIGNLNVNIKLNDDL
jgi:hypothetical protein